MAAADCAQYGTSPPPDLRTAWRFKKWGDPWNKGWWHWPAGLMDRMTVLDNIYTAMKHYTDVRGDLVQWTKQNPGIWEVVTYILKMRSLEDASQELSEKYPQSTVEIFDDLIAVSRGNTAILLKYGIKAERPLGEVTSGWIRRQFGLGSYQG